MVRFSRWFILVAAIAMACANAAASRKAELRRALDQVSILRTPAEIWPEVQLFLSQRGYPLVGDDRLATGTKAQGYLSKLFSVGFQTRVQNDGIRVLETDPRGDTRTRVRVEAYPVEGGGSRLRVRLIKQAEMSTVDTTESRDEDLELALLERVAPAVAARIIGRETPGTTAAPAAPAKPTPPPVGGTSGDRWATVRPLLGTWSSGFDGGAQVRWTFALAGDAQSLEMHGTPLLFAGPYARLDGGEETGRISRPAGSDRFVWNQLTNAGGVDRYEATASSSTTSGSSDGRDAAPRSDAAIVFVAKASESLPAGARARLSLRREGEQLEAALDVAEPGKDLAQVAVVRLGRRP